MELNLNDREFVDPIVDLRRFVLLFTHEFNPKLRFVSEIEVAHAVVEGGEEGGELEVEQAYLDFLITRGFNTTLMVTDTTPDAGSGRGCAVSTSSPTCLDAVNHSDLTWIQANIFATSCNFSGCHSSAADLGKLDLTGSTHDRLVNKAATLQPSRKLVVPNDIHASFFMLMVHDFTPDEATPTATAPTGGFMPKGAPVLCCQKLDAMERWINAGALAN